MSSRPGPANSTHCCHGHCRPWGHEGKGKGCGERSKERSREISREVEREVERERVHVCACACVHVCAERAIVDVQTRKQEGVPWMPRQGWQSAFPPLDARALKPRADENGKKKVTANSDTHTHTHTPTEPFQGCVEAVKTLPASCILKRGRMAGFWATTKHSRMGGDGTRPWSCQCAVLLCPLHLQPAAARPRVAGTCAVPGAGACHAQQALWAAHADGVKE